MWTLRPWRNSFIVRQRNLACLPASVCSEQYDGIDPRPGGEVWIKPGGCRYEPITGTTMYLGEASLTE